MERLGNKLKNAIILSWQDVKRLKAQIKEKYRLYSTQDRAAFLSRSVHEILDRQLTGIPPEDAQKIKKKLLNDALISREKDVSKFDLLLSIFSLPHSEEDTLDMARQWLAESENIDLDASQLKALIQTDDTFATTLTALPSSFPYKKKDTLSKGLRLGVILTCLLLALILNPWRASHESPDAIILYDSYQIIASPIKEPLLVSDSHPFPYEPINVLALKSYLINDRNALIGEAPYFNQIMTAAQMNNIDPLLLFAIIGQEQGFVPKDSDYKEVIINNPFNIYHSWEDYNTTLEDSTQIAINTIKNSLKVYPADQNVFAHLNTTYAEDPNWSIGVELIYRKLYRISYLNQSQPSEGVLDPSLLSQIGLVTSNRK